MPNTKIFSSKSYSSTSYGGISIHGDGDTAKIIFKDHKQNEKSATLKVYQFSKLTKLQLFKEALYTDIEFLVNTWTTKKSQGNIIKFASCDELAFVFSSDNEVEQDFLKLFEGRFYGVEYFNECEFINFLKSLGITIEQLRKVPGMDDERIKLLVNDIRGLRKLLQRGVTLNQIGLIDQTVLKKHLSSSYELDDALQFVTIQQILGLDHTPPVVADVVMPKEEFGTSIGGWGSGSFGDFSYGHSANEVKITHTNKTTKVKSILKVEWGSIKDEYTSQFKKEIAAISPEKLIHNWYLIANKSNEIVTTIYSPELKYLMYEACDPQFPKKEFKEYGFAILLFAPYYSEKYFTDFLIKNGSSLDELSNLQGMTKIKIELLYKNQNNISDLLKEGMKLTDFAKIDGDRLVHVLSHFNKAKSALEFVDVFELFGLRNTSSNYSPRMFHSSASSSINPHVEKVQESSFCTIV